MNLIFYNTLMRVETKLRRRERLTGFLIIFLLLTFSAYSNSMNIGGRSIISPDSFNSQNVGQKEKLRVNESNLSREKKSSQKKDSTFNSYESSSLNTKTGLLDQKTKTKKEESEVFKQEINKKPAPDNQLQNQQKKIIRQKKLIDKIKVHKVKSGETLWDIAHAHGLNIDSLIGANNISNMNNIKPGQEFKILPVKGIIYRVSPGESIASISQKFNLKKETIMKDNDLKDASTLKIDQKLILRGAKPEFSYQDRLDQKFMYPINTRITSYYGPRWGRIHEGLDFAAPMGSPIRSVSSGRVVYSGWASGYGKVVIIQHQRGLKTLYAHNSKLLVRSGESVAKGEVISRSGNTGNSTGPHLHFEVQVNGRPENPLNYIHR